MKYLNILHTIAAILLALFFIYSGGKKFVPKTPKASVSVEEREKADQKKATLANAVETNSYVAPEAFALTMKSMSGTGFLKIVGILQILAGLLMIFKPTRLIGGLILLPVLMNIFLLHLFMDNRMGENIETGFLLLANLLIILFYSARLKDLIIWNHTSNNVPENRK